MSKYQSFESLVVEYHKSFYCFLSKKAAVFYLFTIILLLLCMFLATVIETKLLSSAFIEALLLLEIDLSAFKTYTTIDSSLKTIFIISILILLCFIYLTNKIRNKDFIKRYNHININFRIKAVKPTNYKVSREEIANLKLNWFHNKFGTLNFHQVIDEIKQKHGIKPIKSVDIDISMIAFFNMPYIKEFFAITFSILLTSVLSITPQDFINNFSHNFGGILLIVLSVATIYFYYYMCLLTMMVITDILDIFIPNDKYTKLRAGKFAYDLQNSSLFKVES